jgi:thiol-disulfide isomerase/thioredoxin
MRILIGAGLVGYGIYSGNVWFYLGVIPFIMGIVNWCPMEKMMGGCKDGSCNTGSCETSSEKEDKTSCCSNENKKEKSKSSCCATPKEQISQFTATKLVEKTACCSSSDDKVVIKILGIGCANCVALKNIVDKAVKTIDKECEVIKVEDMQEIMKYQIVSTPGLVINDEVKSVGKLLSVIEVTALINGAGEQKGQQIKTKCCEK